MKIVSHSRDQWERVYTGRRVWKVKRRSRMNKRTPLQEQLKSESQIALEGSEPFQILPDGRILTVKHNYPNNSVDLWEVNSKGEWTLCWIDYGNGHYAVILADLASTIGKRISLIGVFALSVWLLTGTLANGQAATPSKTPAAPKAGAGTNASTPFRDNGDGTVTDTKTGAMWQKDDDGQERKSGRLCEVLCGLDACASLRLEIARNGEPGSIVGKRRVRT